MGSCFTQTLDPQEFLSNLEGIDKRIEPIINPSAQLQQELINLLAESFSGNQQNDPELTCHWWFGQQNADFDSQNRKDLFQYYSKFNLNAALTYGVVYALKDTETGKYGAVALMVPPKGFDNGIFLNTTRTFNVVYKCGIPPDNKNPSKYGNDVEKKSEAMDTIMGPLHLKYKKIPHWYLYVLGVSPQFQGKGYGKAMMNLFNNLADQDNVKSYIECTGEKNLKIYSKYGYNVVGQRQLQYKNDICPHQTYALLRENKNNQQKQQQQIQT